VSGDVVTDNADDPMAALLFAVQHFGPTSRLGNIINNLAWERIGPGIWKFTGTYADPFGDRQTNDSCFSFTTGGGSQHITHSRRTVGAFAPKGQTAPDHKGAIGVSGTNIEGVDIRVSTFDFRTTFYAPPSAINTAYVASLKALTDCVNSAKVTIDVDGVQCTFEIGELSFIGAEGQKRRGFSDWELTLNWSGSRNVTDLVLGPISGITKRGWDYLWVQYQPASDGASSSLVNTPVAVYVEEVYLYADLKPLLLPSGFGISNGSGGEWLTPSVGGSGAII
jgi:hypothetical protein